MDELLCWGENGGGGEEAGGWHRAWVADTMWWGEKGQNIWPESITVEQEDKPPLMLYMLHVFHQLYYEALNSFTPSSRCKYLLTSGSENSLF